MVDTGQIYLASCQSLQKSSRYYKPNNDCGKVAIDTRQNFNIYHMPVNGKSKGLTILLLEGIKSSNTFAKVFQVSLKFWD